MLDKTPSILSADSVQSGLPETPFIDHVLALVRHAARMGVEELSMEQRQERTVIALRIGKRSFSLNDPAYAASVDGLIELQLLSAALCEAEACDQRHEVTITRPDLVEAGLERCRVVRGPSLSQTSNAGSLAMRMQYHEQEEGLRR